MHNQIDLYKKNIFDNLKKFSRIKHKEQHQLLSKKTKPHWFKEYLGTLFEMLRNRTFQPITHQIFPLSEAKVLGRRGPVII